MIRSKVRHLAVKSLSLPQEFSGGLGLHVDTDRRQGRLLSLKTEGSLELRLEDEEDTQRGKTSTG